jgi:hypothetical protein
VEKLRIYPVYRFYSRAQAYGMEGAGGNWTYIDKRKGTPVTMQPVAGYFSAAQFRYVMGVVAQKYDFGYPHRTGHVRDGWKIEFTGNPSRKTTATIVNADPGAKWVHGNTTQARQPAGVGWQVTRAIIDENIEGAIEAMKKAVAEERQKRGIVKKRKK